MSIPGATVPRICYTGGLLVSSPEGSAPLGRRLV